ncbi:hypothetical protein [Streptomyces albireticuli]|uniref:Uncharacterized protein n=1 Tax=Streptomyces albireticuli TaxID=1940 RepID=A0A2A2DDY8_9ACTN|nr:hypothetical protein [Streptomyces albireticuli]MCD9145932.1 hypothetical protein [Streptomyces albireticuli]MCD9166126.1 hypothetical protein [Streptomyces albireticuli]MCD9196451.1 hypothetical protein [Streptomyces albireticuli]PAU50708.1 hypothetical protein CK936_01125 [Streptomyces albireticuli]
MFRRREPVPFAFVAESERYRSNVTPPPRARASRSQLARQALVGITVTAGLVGALLFGMPAMQAGTSTHHTQQSEAKDGR